MNQSSIPLPVPSTLSEPHWAGCREGKLQVQQCGECGAYVFIPKYACPHCLAAPLDWVPASGRGTVYSYTVVHRPQRPEFDVPYVVAIIELEEGWHMLSNIVGCPVDDVAVGMAVEVTFRRMSDAITLPFFRPR